MICLTNSCATYPSDTFLRAHSLDTFMADRPAAAALLREHPALENWLRTEWHGPIEGCRVCWSNDQPTDSPDAEHAWSSRYHLVKIEVSNKLLPVDQLLALSFELCNAQGHLGMDVINGQAVTGQITREDFINEIDRREYAAALRVKKIFEKLLPLSTNELSATSLNQALMKIPDDFHEYQAWSVRIHSQNYINAQKLYGEQYDQLIRK